MRKFTLANQAGERQPLNGENRIWLVNPTGLGMNFDTAYSNIEEGFFGLTKKKEQQATVVADLVFVKTAYENYRNLVDWLMKAERLYLIYQPVGNSQFWREVELNYLTKTEISDGKWLRTPISISGKTPWYLPTPAKVTMTKQLSDAMRYPFTYNDQLHYGISSVGDYAADILPDGHIPAGLRMKYTGAIVKPLITLTGLSGRIYGQIDIGINFTSTERLEISSVPNDTYIRKVTQDGTKTDLIMSGDVDLTQDPFPRAPISEQSTLRIMSEESFTGTAEMEILYFFRSI